MGSPALRMSRQPNWLDGFTIQRLTLAANDLTRKMAFRACREKDFLNRQLSRLATEDFGLRPPKASHGSTPSMLQKNRNLLPPSVMIDSIVVNGKRYPGSAEINLPKHTESLAVDYTVLSLTMPDRVLFRYKLDGVDKTWQDAGTRRQAFYNSLQPGSYRFHVIACNNDGVWNEAGATLGFAIEPALYQTRWFAALCVLMALAMLWWLVRLRIHHVTQQLKERLSERLQERERIARELHDILLQSLFGLMLRFQTTVDRMAPEDPARRALGEALNQSEAVMQEGRERVRHLRVHHLEVASLTDELAELGHQLQTIYPAGYKVSVEGRPRSLGPGGDSGDRT